MPKNNNESIASILDYLFFQKRPKLAGTVAIKGKGVIEFSQSNINRAITSGKLNEIKIQYNGLCEIICNYILLNDMLGENHPLPLQKDVFENWLSKEAGKEQLGMKFKDDSTFVTNYRNKYGEKITVENLRKVEDTHILHVTSFFSRLLALFFSIYPCNLFSNAPFTKSPYMSTSLADGTTETVVDRDMLSEKLSQLDTGFHIKFLAFRKSGFSMNGHSMLIKKTGDNQYTFFDPNHGEYMGLTVDELAQKINHATKEQCANHMAFLDAKEFLNSYQIEEKEVVSASPNFTY